MDGNAFDAESLRLFVKLLTEVSAGFFGARKQV
jgi:hypothetical protein